MSAYEKWDPTVAKLDNDECQHKELQGGYCEECGELIDEDAAAEAAHERSQEGECYRGGEAASALAEEQARIQRELK